MKVQANALIFDEEAGRADVPVLLGDVRGAEGYRRGFRSIEMVFEAGAWKIDAVNTR
jgi:hypothetical protein